MNTDQLNKIVESTMESIQNLLIIKGGEYSGQDDRLANFKRGSALTGIKPLTVLMVYLSKHYDALSTYVRDMEKGEDRLRSEPIEGRLDDLINYCILAKAIIQENTEEDGLTLHLRNGHFAYISGSAKEAFLKLLPTADGGVTTYLGEEVLAYRYPGGEWARLTSAAVAGDAPC